MKFVDYKCPSGHLNTKSLPFHDDVPAEMSCPKCHKLARRVWNPLPHIWKDGKKPIGA